MNIFFLITGLGVGGAEQQVVSLADEMAVLGHKVTLCYITGEAKLLPNEQSIKLIALKAKKNPWSITKALLLLIKIIHQVKPDIIHSHMVHANLMARIVKIFVSKQIVLICSAHNKNEGGKLRVLAYRLTDRLADISTNVSQEAVTAFITQKATKQGRMLVMYNGIDSTKFSFSNEQRSFLRSQWQITDDTHVLLAIGRLTAAKDYPNLLTAFSLLPDLKHQLLMIVGTGEESYVNHLHDLIKQLNIADRVYFLGIRQDINSLLSAADLFVLASEWEGMPLVVAEAMACEQLIVATDSGGVREMLATTGFLVPIKQPMMLAETIEKALNLSLTMRIEVTKKARQRVLMHYNIQQITQQWLKLYQHLIDSKI